MRSAPAPDLLPIPGMNQGTIVAGGGGGSGSGDGNAGEGGDGENGSGGNAGDDANGGGNGAGACGQGGNGACTNCGHNVSRGDPVDVTTGKVFTVPKTDLYLPGTFDLRILRSYSSANRKVDLGMGFGWTHSLAWRMEERGKAFVLHAGDGRRMEVPRLRGSGMWARAGNWGVVPSQQYQVIRPGNEFLHYFSPVEPESKQYKLDFVEYRRRGRISLQYDGPRLARAIDTVGRVILFEGTAGDRIASISVPDPKGRTIVFARYAYDDAGNLVACADADGNVTRYAYDDEHRLVRLGYPSGLAYHFVYDRASRCIETWGAFAGGADRALAPDAPKTLRDGTRAKGIHHCRLDYHSRFTDVTDSVRMQRFAAGPGGKIAKAVDARGGVTTRAFDEGGRVTSVTDPSGATWTYEYDDSGNVIGETDPEGAHVTVERDEAGREVKLVDPAGGVVQIGRDDAGEVTEIVDQGGGTQRFVHDGRGQVEQVVDERGGAHRFELDAHANEITRTHPSGAVERYTFDHWGRPLTHEIDGRGARRFLHSDSGWLLSVVDALGRIFSWEYDSMGNVVREAAPDGSSEAYEYGGLSWRTRILRADGTDVRLAYNREGWLQTVTNERGETYELERDATGRVIRETDFIGCTTTYGRDPNGRVQSYEDGSGKHMLTHSPSGRLVQEEGPDENVRAYAYDKRGELVSALADGNGFSWERGPTGMIVREELTVRGRTYVVESARDKSGDRQALRTSLGHELRTRRDALGKVTELWVADQRTVAITRDPFGVPVRRDFGRGGAVVDEYDAEFRLRRRKLVRAGTETPSAVEPDWVGARLGGLDCVYEYTLAGEVRTVSSSDGLSVEYEYDVRRNLLSRRTNGHSDASFSADASHNYSEKGPNAKPSSFGRGNLLLGYGEWQCRYDARGYLVEKRRAVLGLSREEVTRYEWNPWGYLRAVALPDGARVEFDYDPFARRLAKRVVREGEVVERHDYVWDLVSMVHDVKIDPSGHAASTSTYLFEDDTDDVPIGHRHGHEWVHYVADVTGAPDAIVDGAGAVLGRLSRTPFGRAELVGGQVSTPFRFPGQQEDPETGLHYNRFRYYDPDAGRYISPDPIGLTGGLNLYEYGPNPIGWVDPMGLNKHYLMVEADPADSDDLSWTNNKYPYQDGRQQYKSGKGKWGSSDDEPASDAKNPCPKALATNNKCHTEQKFCYDLMNKYGKNGAVGKNYKLTGQNPPCPNCHRAMMRAAKETGANISYTWGTGKKAQTVTYEGGSGDADTSGVRNRPVKAYGTSGADLDKDWSGIPTGAPGQSTSAKKFWGATQI